MPLYVILFPVSFLHLPVLAGQSQQFGLKLAAVLPGFLQLRLRVLQLRRQVFAGGGQAGHLLAQRQRLRAQLAYLLQQAVTFASASSRSLSARAMSSSACSRAARAPASACFTAACHSSPSWPVSSCASSGGSVFNAADGVRGEGCHGLAPVSQGMAPSYARYEKYTIQFIHTIHTVQNLHTLFLFSWSDPVSGGYGSSSPSAQRYIPSAQHAVPHSVAHGTICCVVSLDCDAPRRGGKQRYDDFLRWYTSGKSFIQIKSDPYETGMR